MRILMWDVHGGYTDAGGGASGWLLGGLISEYAG